MGKGNDTRQQILAIALKIATQSSLNNLTIGSLAVATGMSKSGLFAHFKSKENLQLAVLEYANQLFKQTVIYPVEQVTQPLDKLNVLCEHWLGWYHQQADTCIFISAAVEFDDQPGAVHDSVKENLAAWLNYLTQKVQDIVDAGLFAPDTDAKQFVYELYSLYLGSQSMPWLGLEEQNHSRFKLACANLFSRHQSEVNHEQ